MIGTATARLAEPLAAGRRALTALVPGMVEGQARLATARVRVVGSGPPALPAILSLAEAGVGLLWIDAWDELAGTLSPLAQLGRLERTPTGAVPGATLVCLAAPGEALAAAEEARRAGIPHVVLEADDDGGSVVTVPPGAPCYACARSAGSQRSPARPGAAALASLAALELLLAVALPGEIEGRRTDLAGGLLEATRTVRLSGCACAQAAAR